MTTEVKSEYPPESMYAWNILWPIGLFSEQLRQERALAPHCVILLAVTSFIRGENPSCVLSDISSTRNYLIAIIFYQIDRRYKNLQRTRPCLVPPPPPPRLGMVKYMWTASCDKCRTWRRI